MSFCLLSFLIISMIVVVVEVRISRRFSLIQKSSFVCIHPFCTTIDLHRILAGTNTPIPHPSGWAFSTINVVKKKKKKLGNKKKKKIGKEKKWVSLRSCRHPRASFVHMRFGSPSPVSSFFCLKLFQHFLNFFHGTTDAAISNFLFLKAKKDKISLNIE